MLFEKISISNLIFGILLFVIGADFLLKDALGLEISLIKLLFETSAAKIVIGIFLIYLGFRNVIRAFSADTKKTKQHSQYKQKEK